MSVTNQRPTKSSSSELLGQIADVRKRLFSVGVAAALGWMLMAMVIVLMIAVWFDLLWELPPEARLGSLAIAAGVGLVLFLLLCGSLLKKSSRRWLANRLDQVGETGGEITSGLELSETLLNEDSTSNSGGDTARLAIGANSEIKHGLAAIAVDRAAETAGSIDGSLAVPIAPVKTVAAALVGIGLLLAVLGWSMPKLAKTQWTRFVSPTDDTPPFSVIEFDVTPGHTKLKYGESLDIVAKLDSTPVDELELVIKGASEEDVVPMFSEGDHQWRATLFRVTEDLQYQVRSGRARSEKYDISLILVPEITNVQFRVTPPAYTRLDSTLISASDGIRGLPGTQVEVLAASNRPLSSGQLVLTHKDESEIVQLAPRGNASEVAGQFEIKHGGKFEIQLTDTAGIETTQTVSGSVTLLEDTKPFVRLTSPRQNSWATSTVKLPIMIDAEDDYGISNLSLYRSLNDSRPVPMKFPIRSGMLRWSERTYLPLMEFDLQPGDKLELFARVEDNDQISVKGSESPVHVVQIISREQFERMNREQMGVEAVLAKYRQIQRRLEALEAMQREIEAMDAESDPQANPTDSKKQKILNTANEFKRSAQEMQEMLQRRFPIDFDEDLEPRIAEMSEQMREISRKIRKLVEEANANEIDNEELKNRLEELREELEGIRDAFNKEVMLPLGQLAKIFPLIRKQEMFAQLVLRQRNLADRLRSLDGVDDTAQPDTKRRMRELADEQRTLFNALDNLLFEIEDEAFSLPAEQEFNELRDSALEFVSKVAESGAMDEQQLAEKNLAESSGTLGFKHASEAASILEKLVEQSKGVAQQGEGALNAIFDPEFNRPKFGNSMQQLMDLFGPKNGKRSAGQGNRGLYGDQPMSRQAQRRGSGKGDSRRSGSGMQGNRPAGRNDPAGEVKRGGGATGSGQTTVPLRYKRKVGDYYRRIVEELGEQ